MNYRSVIGKCIATAVGLPSRAVGAAGQQPSLKEQLVGTWMVVSWEQKELMAPSWNVSAKPMPFRPCSSKA